METRLRLKAKPQSSDQEAPYAAAKVYAHWLVASYREAYNLYASNGILFNHEGERRGETFVTRKITRGVSWIVAGLQSEIYLGNLDARRDWGYAKDYVEAMWLMLQAEEADDYVIGTGESHSVREFCEHAFGLVGLDCEHFIKIDPAYFRPNEIEHLRSEPSKSIEKLGWKPKTSFKELVSLMIEADLKQVGLDVEDAKQMAADRYPGSVKS